MRKAHVLITVVCFLLIFQGFSWAKIARKPGLWQMTTTRTFQQTPLPPGRSLPAGAHSPFSKLTTTTTVCLTQAMIDKYGMPATVGQGCELINVVLKETGVRAELVCSGAMKGRGTWESSWSDPEHATGKTHFVGTVPMRQTTGPIEFTTETTSVYEGPNCGSVQPMPMPSEK